MTGGRWRIALLGGTFDPIHAGHLAAGKAVLEQGIADEVIFIPAGQPPHKPAGPLANANHRWCMSVLATLEEPRFRVARWEVDRLGATYAIDTLRIARTELMAQHPKGVDLVWVIGTDAMALIHTWREARALFEIARFAIVTRTTVDESQLREVLLTNAPWLDQKACLQYIAMPPVDVSSTELRTMLAQGGTSGALNPLVSTYIRRYGLYAQRNGT